MISNDVCLESWGRDLKDGMQCTGMVDEDGNPNYGNQHSWSGDSGGPLFVECEDEPGKYTQASSGEGLLWRAVYWDILG